MPGKPVIVFTNPANTRLEPNFRTDTWEGVEAIVREQLTRSCKTVEAPGEGAGAANDPRYAVIDSRLKSPGVEGFPGSRDLSR
jgi:hypothetical protein